MLIRVDRLLGLREGPSLQTGLGFGGSGSLCQALEALRGKAGWERLGHTQLLCGGCVPHG